MAAFQVLVVVAACIVFVRGHLPFSASPLDSSTDVLRQWLHSLNVSIPEITTNEQGFDIVVSNGSCTNITVDEIQTVRMADGLHIQALGLALGCALEWHVHDRLSIATFGGHGGVLADVASSSLKGVLSFTDGPDTPPLPISMSATGCQSNILVTTLRFSGGSFSPLMNAASGLVKSLLSEVISMSICDLVDNLMDTTGSDALRNASADVYSFLDKQPRYPSTPEHLQDPHGDIADLMHNPGILFVQKAFSRALGNASSMYSLGHIAASILGPGGAFELSQLGILPVSGLVPMQPFGVLNVTLTALNLSGLDKWSGATFRAMSPWQVEGSFGLDQLRANAAIIFNILPNNTGSGPLHGRSLEEAFDLDIALQAFGARAGIFVAANRTFLQSLTAEQLSDSDCLAPGLQPALITDAGLHLGLIRSSLLPNTAGALEVDVDLLLNTLLQLLLSEHAEAVQAVGNQATELALRGQLNERIHDFLETMPACPGPQSTYANALLSDGLFATALVLGILTVFSLTVSSAWCLTRAALSVELADVGEGEVEPRSDVGSTWSGPEFLTSSSSECLVFHPRLPRFIRMCLPSLVVVTLLLFLASNSGEGALVRLSITVDGEEVVDMPPVFTFSLISSIQDMWRGGTYPLAILIALFSGLWPYGKLLSMLACWVLPPQVLSIPRRQKLLDFLDAYGKWSLIDTFVLVLFMVAFRFDLSGLRAASPLVAGLFEELGSDAKFSIFIQATRGFHLFLAGTLLSLVLGHLMTACHRYALEVGEYAPRHFGGRDTFDTATSRVCMTLRPSGKVAGRAFTFGPIVALSISLALLVIGLCMDTFQFKFLGLAGYVLGPEKAVQPFSVLSLGGAVPSSAQFPDSFGTRWIQVAYLMFAAVMTPTFLVVLLCLWALPLSKRRQHHLLVAAQVLNAWGGLDVFCMSIMASALQIRQFALFIVADKCDGLNSLIAGLPFAAALDGPKTCFDLDSELRPGFFFLAAAAIIAMVTGHITLARCSKALLTGQGFTEVFPSTSCGAANAAARDAALLQA